MTRPFVFAVAVAIGLAGCANSQAVSSKVAAAEVSYSTVANLAAIYIHLPRCAPTTSGPCSDQALVDKLRALDNQAYRAITAARQNEALLGAALAAIESLQTAIPKS